jgi:MSHA biogenesis protein MshJ
MKPMKPPRVVAYLATLKPRERVVLAACALVFLFVLLEFGVMRPQRAEVKRLQQQIDRNEQESSALMKSLQIARGSAAPDQAATLKAERDKMVEVIQRAQTILQSNAASGNAVEGLRSLTNIQAGLKLVALRTIPPEPIVVANASPTIASKAAGSAQPATSAASAAPAATAAPLQIFRSGVEMTVQGGYPALVAFMSSVEKSAPRLLWGDVNLETSYPESRLRLTLYSIDTRSVGLVE